MKLDDIEITDALDELAAERARAERWAALTPDQQDAARHRGRWLRAIRAWSLSAEEATAVRVPPIPYPQGLHPAAAAWICRQMWRITGSVAWDERLYGNSWRQGWDSEGHWGIGAGLLQAIRLACPRGTGLRMRALLRYAVRRICLPALPKNLRGLSDRAVIDLCRCSVDYSWAERLVCVDRAYTGRVYLHWRARRDIGRLSSPLLQRIAAQGAADRALDELLERFPDLTDEQIRDEWSDARTRLRLRSRHLNWRGVQDAARQLAVVPAHVRPRIERALWIVLCGKDMRGAEGPVCPAYPLADPVEQARVVLGERPAQIHPDLTAAEAHDWMTSGSRGSKPAWLIYRSELGRQHAVAADSIRTVGVARWLIAAYGDPARRDALEREREIHGPHGELMVVRYRDRVDEIRDEDLAQGPRTSVDGAFRAAAERMHASAMEFFSEQHRPLIAAPPAWLAPALIPAATLLRTPAQLVAEGRDLSHCVGGYTSYVASGQSVIVSLRVPRLDREAGTVEVERSTIEFDEHGHVRQHRGYGNSNPHQLCERALAVMVRKIKVAP